MATCQGEAENGINHFIEEQRKHDGECLFSLVQFDTEYEFVHSGNNIRDIPKYHLEPRGMTALLDAVGRAVKETGIRLANMAEEQRPGLVVFGIVTDGHENSSHEFTKSQIKQMIETQQQSYQWQFTFLGANQDAFAEAASIGIPGQSTMNYAPSKSADAYACMSQNVSQMRSCCRAGGQVTSSYSHQQREAVA